MSVRVRLTRVGSKKSPAWRVVVADQRSRRDGRIIEQIGHYDPRPHPSRIVIDRVRLDHWLERGAEPTNTVRKLMRAPTTPHGPAASGSEPPETAQAAVAAAPEPATENAVDAEEAGSDRETAVGSPADVSASDAPGAAGEPQPPGETPDESS